MAFKVSVQKNKNPKKFPSFIGGMICAVLSLTAFYIVFFGDQLTGGIPLIPESANQLIGKTFFFGGAVFTGLLALLAFKEFRESFKKKD